MSRKGRKRKPAKRHPNGRIVQPSPAQKQEDALQGPLEARTRVYGLDECAVAEIQRGYGWTVLRRLEWQENRAKGTGISERQRRAGEMYARIVDDMRRARAVPPDIAGPRWPRMIKPEPGSVEVGMANERSRILIPQSEEEYALWCRDAIRTYEACRRALLEAPDPLAMMACETVCCDDRENFSLEAALRIGLNALVRILLGETKKAA